MHDKPTILVLGPSAVGKSHFLNELEHDYSFLSIHIDTDHKKRSFKANGFPEEWDEDYENINFEKFVSIVRRKLNGYAGAAVSFPTLYVLSIKKLAEASEQGVIPVILWGTKERCIHACKERRKQKKIKFNLADYEKKNNPTFRAYCRPEYNSFKVEAFQPDGSRIAPKKWFEQIIGHKATVEY